MLVCKKGGQKRMFLMGWDEISKPSATNGRDEENVQMMKETGEDAPWG